MYSCLLTRPDLIMVTFKYFVLLVLLTEAITADKAIEEVDCYPSGISKLAIGHTGVLLECNGRPKDAAVHRVNVWYMRESQRHRLFTYSASRGYPKATSNVPERLQRLSTEFTEDSAKMTLYLDDAKKEDSGVYGCTFVSSNNNQECSTEVEIKKLDVTLVSCSAEGGPKYPMGETVDVQCSYFPRTAHIEKITCWFSSQREKSKVNLITYNEASGKTDAHADHPDLSSRVTMLYDRVTSSFHLRLKNMRSSDSGTYGCSVFSETTKPKGEVTIKFQNLEVENVKFNGSRVHEVDVHGEATFSCLFYPTKANIDIVRWYKIKEDRKSLVYMYIPSTKQNEVGPKYKNRVDHTFHLDEGRSTLIIKNCKQADLGIYGCRFISAEQDIMANASLWIRGKKEVVGSFEVCTFPEPVHGLDAADVCQHLCNSSLPDMSSNEQDTLLRDVMTQKQVRMTWVTMGKWLLDKDKERCDVARRKEEGELEVIHKNCNREQHVICLRQFDVSMELRYQETGAEITCKYSPKHVASHIRWLRTFGNEEPMIIYDFNPRNEKRAARVDGMKRLLSYNHDPDNGSTSLVIRTSGLRYAGLYTCEITVGKNILEAPGPLAVEEIVDYHGKEALVLPLLAKESQSIAACAQYGLYGLPNEAHRDILNHIFPQFDISSSWAECSGYGIYDSPDLCCLAKQQEDDVTFHQVSCEDLAYVVCIGYPGNYEGVNVLPGKRQFQKAMELCADLGVNYRIVDREWTTALIRLDHTVLGNSWSAWVTHVTKEESAETCPNNDNCCEIVIWQDGAFRNENASCYDIHHVVCTKEGEYRAGTIWFPTNYIKKALIGLFIIVSTYLIVKYSNSYRQ